MKNSWRTETLVVLLFVFVYLISRLYHLTSIPVFGDEAIYLRWSQIIKSVDTLRFIPQTDGKQPLFMWITVLFFKLIHDPLVAGRCLSVLAGAINLTVLYLTARIFLNKRIAVIVSFLYLCLPFTFFFDRLALPDNLLSMFGSLSLLVSLLLAKNPRLDLAIILGGVLGLSWLTKSPAIYFIVLSVVTFVSYRPTNYHKIYFPLLSSVIATVIYNILRLGPQFSQIAIRNRDYIWPLSEIIKHPLDPLLPHLRDLIALYTQYIGWPVMILSILGLTVFHSKKNLKELFIFSLWFILPLVSNMAIAKVFTGRYILFTIPSLLLLISTGISQLAFRSTITVLLLLLSVLPSVVFNWQLSTVPFSAKLYSTESGYIKSWTSGWGIEEASQYLIERSKVANIIVGTEGYFGTLPDGLQIYTNQLPQLTVFGVGLDITTIPEKLVDARNHQDEVYLLFNNSRLKLTPEQYSHLSLVKSYPKPDGDNLLLLKLN